MSWKWSRIKVLSSSKVSGALLSIFILGTLLSLDNVAAKIGLDLGKNNIFISFFFGEHFVISSIELAYLASVLQFAAYISYVLFSPRNIDISLSRFDFVSRSLGSLNNLNILRWYEEISREIDSVEIVYSSEIQKAVFRNIEFLKAQHDVSSDNIDKTMEESIVRTLQEKYEFLNSNRSFARTAASLLMVGSFGLGFISICGTINDNLLTIFYE